MTIEFSSWRLLTATTLLAIVAGVSVGYGQEPTTPQEASPKVTTPRQTPKRTKVKTPDATTPTAETTTGDQTTTTVPQEQARTSMSSPTEQTDLSGTYTGTFRCD